MQYPTPKIASTLSHLCKYHISPYSFLFLFTVFNNLLVFLFILANSFYPITLFLFLHPLFCCTVCFLFSFQLFRFSPFQWLVSICPFFFLVFLFLSHTFSIGLVFLISMSLKVYSLPFFLSFCILYSVIVSFSRWVL